MLLEVESRRKAAMLRMRSAEPRSSVSNNRIKDVSDDWFESWWELQISKIIWTSGNCITLCRPDLMLHDRPLLCIRTRTRQALQVTVTCFGKVAEGGTHHWDARFLTQVYPSLKLLGSTAFISETEDHLNFILCLSFFLGMKSVWGSAMTTACVCGSCCSSTAALSRVSISESSHSLYHTSFYFLANKRPSITSQKLKYS